MPTVKVAHGENFRANFSTVPVEVDGIIGENEWADGKVFNFISVRDNGEVNFYMKYNPIEHEVYAGFLVTNDSTFDVLDAFGLALDMQNDRGNQINQSDWYFIVTRAGGAEVEVVFYQFQGADGVWQPAAYAGINVATFSANDYWSAELAFPLTITDGQKMGLVVSQTDGSVTKATPVVANEPPNKWNEIVFARQSVEILLKEVSWSPGIFGRGEKIIKISGSITPALDNQSMTMRYLRLGGKEITRKAVIASDGSFSDSITPDMEGVWSVQAIFEGDETHASASSGTYLISPQSMILILSIVIIVAMLGIVFYWRSRRFSKPSKSI